MKTYQFTIKTPSYGAIHTIVTCSDPDAIDFLDADKLAQDRRLVDKTLTPKVLKKTNWQFFTVRALASSNDSGPIKIQELEPLTKTESLLALHQINIRKNEIYEELEGLSIASISHRSKRARQEAQKKYDALQPSNQDWNIFCNQKTLIMLALRNPDNILGILDT